MTKRRTEKIIAFIFWIIGASLLIASMLTDFWISTRSIKFGLFDYCVFESVCVRLEWLYHPDSPIFLNIFIPRVLLLGGGAFIALGLVIGILGIFSGASCPVKTEGILDILGGLTILIGCTIFTARNFEATNLRTVLGAFARNHGAFVFGDGANFHFSFYFGWISGLMFIIAGICSVIAGSKRY